LRGIEQAADLRQASTLKYPDLICTRCNNDRTSEFDRAYDRLSDWFATQQNNYAITEMDFREVFDKNYVGSIDALRRYCAKALGCRILASGYRRPANLFPNPVSDIDVSILQLSICRVQPFRHIKKFRPDMMERVLSRVPYTQTSVGRFWSRPVNEGF
jgi:hypothetical protein